MIILSIYRHLYYHKTTSMNLKIWLLFLALPFYTFANDGAYYASGNQLIPITETDICVTKEILTITKKEVNGTTYVYVTVDYTFFNPNNEKSLLVGFEAPSPNGDVNGYPKNGAHPYISNFDVVMNGKALSHKTAIVNSDNYYINNAIDAKTENEVIEEGNDGNYVDFYYVYHFNALFKPGDNTIKHTYRFNMSGSIMDRYNFDYILTAANRWENNQIDDFTLHINMGNNEGFNISNTFFNSTDEWIIKNGRALPYTDHYRNTTVSKFIVKNGGITFKKKNFTPEGELSIYATADYIKRGFEVFDYTKNDLPESITYNQEDFNTSTRSANEDSHKILRNFPFARKGYIFKTPLIQNYYLSQDWYFPNPSYKADLNTLPIDEGDWLEAVKTNGYE